MSAGRTGPLLLGVRFEDGSSGRCVTKLSARLDLPQTTYVFEWLAAAVGRAIGLNVPEPIAVEITKEFADAIDDPALRALVQRSLGLAYGSTFEKGYTQITVDYALSSAQREEAARVLAFDVFIHNADRRRENPNLHISRDRFLVFDHEQAFSFLLAILAPDPVSDHCADILDRHVLRSRLLGLGVSLADAMDRIRALDDTFFQALRDRTPAAWTQGDAVGKIDRVLDVLHRRRDAAHLWIPRVEACLAK